MSKTIPQDSPPDDPLTMRLGRRLASRIVVGYIRDSPFPLGKWRLLKSSIRFLTVEVERGISVRVSGMEDTYLAKGWVELDEAQHMLSFLKPGMTFFDVGANIGLYSLMAAKRVGPNGSVHSFEPTPSTTVRLKENVRLNKFQNIKINQLALSDRRGTADFHIHDADDRNSLCAISDQAITVPTLTIDEYVEENTISSVDFIKVDVEGAEFLVFTGASKLLSGPNAPIIMFEIYPPALEQMGTSEAALIELLESYGYQVCAISQHKTYRNAVATKPQHRQFGVTEDFKLANTLTDKGF